MRVALTGTPGTGKSSVADDQDRFSAIDLGEFAERRGLGESSREFEVDVEALNEALQEELGRGDYLLESHFAHLVDADCCVVLRCHPGELEGRLMERGYPRGKVEENLEAEAMALVLQEAERRFERLMELDTTSRDAEDVADEMVERLDAGEFGVQGLDFSGWL